MAGGGDVTQEARPNRFEWALGVGIVAIFFAWVAWVLLRPDPDNLLFSFGRNGGDVVEDVELNELLAGDLSIPAEALAAAQCDNVWYWRNDRSLNQRLVVASAPRLIRAAEIVAADMSLAAVASAVEARTDPDGVVTESALEELSAEFGDDLLRQYLDARRDDPAPESVERFVVWATNTSTTRQVVRFVDYGDLRPDPSEDDHSPRFTESGRGREIGLAGSGVVLVENITC